MVAAVTYTWTQASSGTWNTAADWSPTSGPPGSGTPDVDVAVIGNLGVNYTVGVASGTVDLKALDIGTSASTGPALTITTARLNTDTLDYTTASGKGATNITINGGGVFDVRSTIADANSIAETITISGKGGGGQLILGNMSTAINSHVTDKFSDTTGSLAAGDIEFATGFTNGGTVTQAISGVGWGNELIVDGANFAAGDTATLSGTALTVKTSGGAPVFTFSNVALLAKSATTFIVSGNDVIAICYARGTMIRTPAGEVPVERLRAGKQVITLADGDEVARPVKWLGHRRINLANHARPETVAPIRIQHGAFANNMPHRDLVVSPDHAIFVDGKLVCARQLVNGTTIRQETNWTAVDYYHVELDRHAILLAEGLPAESYIDTGNSGFFGNSGKPLVLHPDLTDESDYPTRETGSCAPFVWDAANVQPIWQRLADRAAALGQPVPVRETSTDGGLHLVARGRTIKPIYDNADLAIFALPRGASEVRLVSRAASPTDASPWLEDRRRLGVRVARIVLRSVDDMREVPVDHPELVIGWWAVERDGQTMCRWTNGEAILPLPAMHGDAMLEIHLAGAMTYVVEATLGEQPQRRVA